MRRYDALELHIGDEIIVKRTGEVTTVLEAFEHESGQVLIETTYNGYTVFTPNEIG